MAQSNQQPMEWARIWREAPEDRYTGKNKGHLIPHLSQAAVNCYQGTEIIFSPWPVVLALGPCNIKWTLCELKQKLIKFIKLAWLLRKKSSSIKLDITDSKQTVSSYTDI